MIELILDTHALVWYLANSPRLSSAGLQAIKASISRGGQLGLSTMTLVEILYLEEKSRIHAGSLAAIVNELRSPGGALVEVPLSGDIVQAMRGISRSSVPELPDRVIAATASYLSIPLVTADTEIRSSGIHTIW